MDIPQSWHISVAVSKHECPRTTTAAHRGRLCLLWLPLFCSFRLEYAALEQFSKVICSTVLRISDISVHFGFNTTD